VHRAYHFALILPLLNSGYEPTILNALLYAHHIIPFEAHENDATLAIRPEVTGG